MADLVAWVEQGVEPPPSTNYEWSDDGRLSLAPTADERGGLQAVVELTVQGRDRARVGVGDEVQFELSATMATGRGSVVAIEWDFDGSGQFAVTETALGEPTTAVMTTRAHVFGEAGVYFPVARVWSQREPGRQGELFRVANLGRVRIVVT